MTLSPTGFSFASQYWPTLSSDPSSTVHGKINQIFDIIKTGKGPEKSKNLHTLIGGLDPATRDLVAQAILDMPLENMLCIFKHINSTSQRILLKSLPPEKFDSCIKQMIDSPLLQEKRELAHLIFASLSEIGKLDSLVIHLCKNLKIEDFCKFLLIPQETDFVYHLIVSFLNQSNDHAVYCQLLSRLCDALPMKNANLDVHLALRTLMAYSLFLFSQSTNWQNFLIGSLKSRPRDLSFHAVNTFLWLADPGIKNSLAYRFAKDPITVAAWLKGVLELEECFEKKVELFRAFTCYMDEQQILKVLRQLKSDYPEALSYFPCALTDGMFFRLTSYNADKTNSLSNPETMADFLILGPDQDIKKIANTLKKQDRLAPILHHLRFRIKRENENVDLSLGSLHLQMKTLLAKPNWKELVDPNELKPIPPYLLALGMFDKDTQEFIVKCVSYWTEQQLKVVAKAFSLEMLREIAKDPGNQIEALFDSLSKDVIIAFCKDKDVEIMETFKTFEQKIREFSRDLKLLDERTKKGETLTEEAYEKLLKRNQRIRALVTPPSFVTALFNRAKGLTTEAPELNRLIAKNKELRNRFLTYQQLPHRKLLGELQKYLPEEKEETALSGDILELLTRQTVENLGIKGNFLAFLKSRGICSDEDFALLGYNINRQNLLKKVRRFFLEFGLNDNKSFDFCKREQSWDSLFYSNTINHKHFLEDRLKVLSIPRDVLIKTVNEIVSTILKDNQPTAFLGKKGKKKFEENAQELRNFPHSEKSEKICMDYLRKALIWYRTNEPTVQLKKYLSQPGLEEKWKELNAKSISSLSQLKLKSTDQIYALQAAVL